VADGQIGHEAVLGEAVRLVLGRAHIGYQKDRVRSRRHDVGRAIQGDAGLGRGGDHQPFAMDGLAQRRGHGRRNHRKSQNGRQPEAHGSYVTDSRGPGDPPDEIRAPKRPVRRLFLFPGWAMLPPQIMKGGPPCACWSNGCSTISSGAISAAGTWRRPFLVWSALRPVGPAWPPAPPAWRLRRWPRPA